MDADIPEKEQPDFAGFCTTQLYRLHSIGSRRHPTAWDEVGRALKNASHNKAHAKYIIDTILETFRTFPTPADVWVIARDSISRFESVAKSDCDQCGGSGWISIEKGRYPFSDYCSCAKGRRLHRTSQEKASREPSSRREELKRADENINFMFNEEPRCET